MHSPHHLELPHSGLLPIHIMQFGMAEPSISTVESSASLSFRNPNKQNHAIFYPYKYSSLRTTWVAFSYLASAEASNWGPDVIQYSNGKLNPVKSRAKLVKRRGEEDNQGEEAVAGVLGERRVKCEVDVVSWRERRVKAEISVNACVSSVWNALTDYERLADFIPNLVSRYILIQLWRFYWENLIFRLARI